MSHLMNDSMCGTDWAHRNPLLTDELRQSSSSSVNCGNLPRIFMMREGIEDHESESGWQLGSRGAANPTSNVACDFAWQGGYGVFSIGQSQVDDVRAYVAGQEDHRLSQNLDVTKH